MSLQKYRADITDPPEKNGSVGWSARWVGGPTLALVRNCPIDSEGTPPRTVYVTGEPDTFFSLPAACKIRGKTVRGWIGREDDGWKFHPSREIDVGQNVLEPTSNVGQ
jgi:hypothetical protein